MKKEKFSLIFNIFLAFFITLVVTLFVQGMGGTLTAEHFIIGMIQGFAINLTLEEIINLPAIGTMVCVKVGIKNLEGPAAYIVRIFIIVFIMVILMSFLLMFCEVGFSMGTGFFSFWLLKVPAIFVVAYITALITVGPCMKLTGKICSK